ncbi:MAG: hypothetical protein AB8G15_06430 [Saprospiraceae bacterium]
MKEEKRRLISPIEMLLLVVGLGSILYVVYPNNGVSIFEKTEEVEFVDKPKSTASYQSPKKSYPDKREQAIDQVLANLAQEFAQTSSKTASEKLPSDWRRLGLSTDEVKFYKKIKDTYKFDEQLKNTQDWFAVLQTANATYRKVNALFQETNGLRNPKTKQGQQDHLTEKGGVKPLSSKLQKAFGLSEEALSDFSKKGKNTVSEWASFILENQ